VANALNINDKGEVVGAYIDPTAPGTINLDGFLLSKGVYRTFDAPDALLTLPLAISNRGEIVGVTAPGPGAFARGFVLREGAEGPFTRIEFPGAPGTGATGINDRGQIVGVYENPAATPDRQPSPMQMPMMMLGSDG
jgi:hypothetical protein